MTFSPLSAFTDGRVNRNSIERGTLRIEVGQVDNVVTNGEITVAMAGKQTDILSIWAKTPSTRVIVARIPAHATAEAVNVIVDIGGRNSDTGTFTYEILQPVVVSQSACKACNTGKRCLVNGRCGGNAIPFASRAPFSSQSTLTILIDSLNVGASLDSIKANLGSNKAQITASNIVSASDIMSVVEFQLAQGSANRGADDYSITLTGNTQTSLSFRFTFFDDTIDIQCAGGCLSKVPNGAPVVLAVRGLSVVSNDQIEYVRFGDIPAHFVVDASNSGSSVTAMTVTPPTSVNCSYAAR